MPRMGYMLTAVEKFLLKSDEKNPASFVWFLKVPSGLAGAAYSTLIVEAYLFHAGCESTIWLLSLCKCSTYLSGWVRLLLAVGCIVGILCSWSLRRVLWEMRNGTASEGSTFNSTIVYITIPINALNKIIFACWCRKTRRKCDIFVTFFCCWIFMLK